MFAKIKTHIIGGAALALIILGLFLGKAFRRSDIVQDTIYSRMEDVKHLKHLELVTYAINPKIPLSHFNNTNLIREYSEFLNIGNVVAKILFTQR